MRLVIGALREEGLLNNTIICFTSDHGNMLGNPGLWAKRLFYEYSANIPMILLGVAGDERVGHHRVDDRLVGWQDIQSSVRPRPQPRPRQPTQQPLASTARNQYAADRVVSGTKVKIDRRSGGFGGSARICTAFDHRVGVKRDPRKSA